LDLLPEINFEKLLCYSLCLSVGNLGRVDYISEFEFDLFIRPDTCNPRFRVWFNFTVENVRETQVSLDLHRDSLQKITQRLPAKNVYYYRCPDHRRNYVMSFAFCFDREDDVYQFSYCYPYTYSRLQHYLASLERRNLDYLQREQLGLSVVSYCMFAHCVTAHLCCVSGVSVTFYYVSIFLYLLCTAHSFSLRGRTHVSVFKDE
uniref:ATP/GTP binding protein-like 4 n=1 Tax=Cyprinus carpio TaxID=7962 RepID=A0A8C2AZ00_CYPCA